MHIETNSIHCDGGDGPLGHPLVYLAFNEEGEVICPYCGTHYAQSISSSGFVDLLDSPSVT